MSDTPKIPPIPSLSEAPLAPDPFEAYLTDGKLLGDIVQELEHMGETVNPLFIDHIDDIRLINGLREHCEKTDDPLINFFLHSNRFSSLNRWDGLHDRANRVVVPQSPDNIHESGQPRREEAGDRFNMDYLVSKGIDPKFVLYFRVTQPTSSPKPEYYWTSDFTEVRYGLNAEGSRRVNSIILVSSLYDISRNGGLMMDVNDDSGIAVRQIGLKPYSQQDALFSFKLFDN